MSQRGAERLAWLGFRPGSYIVTDTVFGAFYLADGRLFLFLLL